MDRIPDLTRECFDAVIELRRLDEAALPPPETLHARLRAFVDALLERARAAGLSREDALDLAYPAVALADEVAQARSERYRQYWADHLLQLHYFGENVAGEELFNRLAANRRDPRRLPHLEAYYTALVLGFQGRYRVRGGELELMTLVEELQRTIARGNRHDDVLSPRGERPREAAARRDRRGFLAWAVLGLTVVVLATWGGLVLSSGANARALSKRIAAIHVR